MIGTSLHKDKLVFKVYAPYIKKLQLNLLNVGKYEAEKDDNGNFTISVDNVSEGQEYNLVLDNNQITPDPLSRYQPYGVHGNSTVINTDFDIPEINRLRVEDLIIYEIHVGTFSSRGDFRGIIEKLDYLKDLGVTAIEIMPIAQFPGERDWGYDGTYLFAVQNTYGGPKGLAELVKEAHKRNLGVILDVVYNHVGPEGNYLIKLGPYFSEKYRTPWGLTFNFDDRGSDEVRKLVIDNVKYWLDVFKVDGLRLDAVHAIFDMSPKHILQEIAETVHNRNKIVIAESDLNDPKIVREDCGYGIDMQWVDDFHHSVHAYVTKERSGYYSDFGTIKEVEKSFKDVFVYNGKFSKYRGKTHGAPVGDLPRCKFTVYIQNHDQVGNRGDGERLSVLVDKESYLIASALYILSPYIPMLFMGEEYFEANPFLFFSDFSDPQLIKGVREGRLKENGQTTDPQSPEAFQKSKLSWNIDKDVLHFYKKLIEIRRNYLIKCKKPDYVESGTDWITIKIPNLLIIASFRDNSIEAREDGSLLLGINFPERIQTHGQIKICKGIGVYQTA
ncbi:malto-oligosyltrehalose trehalohydrolase [Sulfolobales archaeon HS-7]|nr:malto-oligosyltrehalose trehalohydrolase [Sulfolobales archaeon HS-7]